MILLKLYGVFKFYCYKLMFRAERLRCTLSAKRVMGSYGKRLLVNHPCIFNGNVTVGDYCNFNGMQVLGGG